MGREEKCLLAFHNRLVKHQLPGQIPLWVGLKESRRCPALRWQERQNVSELEHEDSDREGLPIKAAPWRLWICVDLCPQSLERGPQLGEEYRSMIEKEEDMNKWARELVNG